MAMLRLIHRMEKKELHGTVIAAYQEKQLTMNGETTVSQYDVFTNLILHTKILYQTT